jgi:hypothetical protein
MQFGPRARFRAFPQLLPNGIAHAESARAERTRIRESRSFNSIALAIDFNRPAVYVDRDVFSGADPASESCPDIEAEAFLAAGVPGRDFGAARWRKYNTARREC